MNSDNRNRGNLGRGLSALLGSDLAEEPRLARLVPIELLHPSTNQPRKHFDDEAFSSLVDSVRDQGVLQPILVRPHKDTRNEFEIVAGERRWRAAQQSQLHEIPVIVRDLNDTEMLEIALIENLQREELTPIEEGDAYWKLINEFGLTQEAVAQKIGKSRSYIANTIRLLSLPSAVKHQINEGLLSAGHARALLGTTDPEALGKIIIRQGLSVRQAETYAHQDKNRGVVEKKRNQNQHDPNISALEQTLYERLGLKVKVSVSGEGGVVKIYYSHLEQFDEILHRLSVGPSRK